MRAWRLTCQSFPPTRVTSARSPEERAAPGARPARWATVATNASATIMAPSNARGSFAKSSTPALAARPGASARGTTSAARARARRWAPRSGIARPRTPSSATTAPATGRRSIANSPTATCPYPIAPIAARSRRRVTGRRRAVASRTPAGSARTVLLVRWGFAVRAAEPAGPGRLSIRRHLSAGAMATRPSRPAEPPRPSAPSTGFARSSPSSTTSTGCASPPSGGCSSAPPRTSSRPIGPKGSSDAASVRPSPSPPTRAQTTPPPAGP